MQVDLAIVGAGSFQGFDLVDLYQQEYEGHVFFQTLSIIYMIQGKIQTIEVTT